MKTTNIDSIDSLLKKLNELPSHYIFRGHASANWKLESTLERILGNDWSSEKAKKFEQYSLDCFQSKFHLYDRENTHPKTKLGWLSVMQHYGVPTRLLDFTESPFVALYFAFEAANFSSLESSKNDSIAVIALDYRSLMESSIKCIREKNERFDKSAEYIEQNKDTVFEDTVDPHTYDIAWVTEPRQLNKRIDRQSGCFLLSGNKGVKTEDILANNIYNTLHIEKFVIPLSFYTQLFALLRKMNINSKTIYGDLQGLAKSIKIELQVYAS